ncbi:2-hydroxyglutaryl-CoA dehydratase [Desulfoluna limicola]|uniref:2-hydroxyglutaryl-CoA dehydratase n=1 Tax=Desulfoluna limicola TaxID=2810562 RepID=A0ABN6F549_9BACT|nr:acyl-CoA dehydratase activase [Desulfoluna limicola]BCS96685.1 2-hydroxyglutaryl-CoA dehydratase [Desulfoluna limicola]
MSLVAGCDVGSLTTKAVIMRNGRVAGALVIPSGPRPAESAAEAMERLCAEMNIAVGDIKCCVGTGYGRESIPFIDTAVSEISCHGKGARWLVPSARTVIDIGGQDCKVIRIDGEGNIVKFVTNDKCASGTGRFLDVMAKVMNIDASRLGTLGATSNAPVTFPSTCTVWAQADVIKHINARCPPEDICAGINTAMANRVSMLANALKVENDICMTGGVAKNEGVVNALSRILGRRIKRTRRADPQLTGALGAALFAGDRV